MAEKQTHYLRQLRDQVAESFDAEELRALVFDLGLDWDELQGARKTTRVQDLIVQLGRSGRLSELVDLVREERPHINWPDVPPAKQQIQIRDRALAKPGNRSISGTENQLHASKSVDPEQTTLVLAYSDHCLVDLNSVKQVASAQGSVDVVLQWHSKVLHSLARLDRWHYGFQEEVRVFQWAAKGASPQAVENMSYLRAQVAKYHLDVQTTRAELEANLLTLLKMLENTEGEQREWALRSFAGFAALRLIQRLQVFESRIFRSQHGPLRGVEGFYEAVPLGIDYLGENEFNSFSDLPIVPVTLLELVPEHSTLAKLVFFYDTQVYYHPYFLYGRVGPTESKYEYLVLPKVFAEWLHSKGIRGHISTFYQWVLPQWLALNYQEVPRERDWEIWVLKDKLGREKYFPSSKAPWE